MLVYVIIREEDEEEIAEYFDNDRDFEYRRDELEEEGYCVEDADTAFPPESPEEVGVRVIRMVLE